MNRACSLQKQFPELNDIENAEGMRIQQKGFDEEDLEVTRALDHEIGAWCGTCGNLLILWTL
jgi:hypothetical protein